MQEVTGTFAVKVIPAPQAPADGLSRYTLDKVFEGGLTGTSKGEMLSGGDPKTGNAGYVAIERVVGTLESKSGSFALMQSGTMSKGEGPQMTVTIVPGSGTGALRGLYGTMTIAIAPDGGHSYTMRYGFPSE
jgi:hypothetical protein